VKKKKKKKHATKKEVQNIIKKDITMRHLNELSLFLKRGAARRNRLRSNLRSKTERCWFSRNTRKIIIMPLHSLLQRKPIVHF